MKTDNFHTEVSDDYTVYKKTDVAALVKAIDIIKGKKTIEEFAKECEINPIIFYRTYSGERVAPIHFSDCVKIYNKRCPECRLSFDDLLSANGYIRKDRYEEALKEMDDNLDTIANMPGRNAGQTRKRGGRPPKDKNLENLTTECGFDPAALSYDEFLDDLAYYSMGKPVETLKLLHEKQHRLFQNKDFVKLIRLYHLKSTADSKGGNALIMLNYGQNLTGHGLDKLDRTAQHYKQLIEVLIETIK